MRRLRRSQPRTRAPRAKSQWLHRTEPAGQTSMSRERPSLKRRVAPVVVTNANRVRNIEYEYFAVTDFAGSRGRQQGMDHRVAPFGRNNDLQLDFRKEVNFIL